MGVNFTATLLLGLSGCCLQLETGRSNASSSGGASAGGTTGGEASCTQTGCPPPIGCLGALICDPGDGKCKCYLGGPSCYAGDGCNVYGSCSGPLTLCNCSPPCDDVDTVCSRSDGQCHCATEGGPICKGGTCQLVLADSGAPVPDGGAGDAPIAGECSGSVDPCHGVSCSPGEECDPTDTYPETGMGRCACGLEPSANLPGVVCAYNEVCLALAGGRPACLRLCSPFAEPCFPLDVADASAPIAQGCYYFFPAFLGMVCAPPTGDLGEGQPCQRPTDCAPPFTCAQSAVNTQGPPVMACVRYCDLGLDAGCPPGTYCLQLPDAPVGICEQQ